MDTPAKLNHEEVQYQQTYDYTWEANLEQELSNAKRMLIGLKGRGITDCPPALKAEIIALISRMKFFLTKYGKDTKFYDNEIEVLNSSSGLAIYDAIMSEVEQNFANEAGYLLNFRAKTDKRESWENFL